MEISPMPHEPMSFQHLAAAAAKRHEQNGWPGSRDEAWRYTNLNALKAQTFTPAKWSSTLESSDDNNLIHFVNGVLQGTDNNTVSGLKIESLSANTELATALAEAVPDSHSVADFALAHASDGLAITVTGEVEAPLMFRFSYEGDGISSHPVVVVDLKPGASLTILEEHIGSGAGLSAPLMLFRLDEEANLHHARRLIEDESRYHLGLNLVQLNARALYHGDMVMSGGDIARSETQVRMTAPDAEAYLNAVYLGRHDQMRDVTSRIDHDAPDGKSFQRIHGILDDRAKAVFQGKVKVARYAQKTDGNQMSRTLILSRQAEANTKPELEIYADDVTCSHGATIGEMDADQLFYLKSRGISDEDARQLLIEAFLVDVIDELGAPQRDWLMAAIQAWIEVR
jgi:Fe-S cluster assembly protein SufD